MDPITAAELELIERSKALIRSEPETFTRRFYARLFKLAPATRSLFPSDMHNLRSKLVDELAFLLSAASDLESFVERSSALGQRHAAYGVQQHHYEILETALLGTLAEAAGVAWNDELHDAWQALYRHIAAAMQNPTSH